MKLETGWLLSDGLKMLPILFYTTELPRLPSIFLEDPDTFISGVCEWLRALLKGGFSVGEQRN